MNQKVEPRTESSLPGLLDAALGAFVGLVLGFLLGRKSSSPASGNGGAAPAQQPPPAPVADPDWLTYWEEASKNLMPDKTLTRLTEHAKYIVTTVTVVGSLLTGLGVLTVTVTDNDGLTIMAFLVLVLAALAVCIALGTLLVRIRTVHYGNLLDVERFYVDEINRKRPLRLASGLLLAAAGIAAFTGVLGAVRVVTGPLETTNRATLTASASGDSTTADARIDIALAGSISGLDDDQVLDVRIESDADEVVLVALAYPDQEGTVKLDRTLAKVPSGTLTATATLNVYSTSAVNDGTVAADADAAATYVLTASPAQ